MDFTNLFASAKTPQEKKDVIMNEIRNQTAVENARLLIEKINEHCYEKCIPKPGTSLSSGEESCIVKCMDKYMAAWNVVSKQYISRAQREGEAAKY
ncbi:Tim10/DDP family zinc finger-domain-containing protein [Kalaharituber pfeilii]|nr:Tim10/DDP family zinc finger-domain-containing protein [Kalaharituber pfeilii]